MSGGESYGFSMLICVQIFYHLNFKIRYDYLLIFYIIASHLFTHQKVRVTYTTRILLKIHGH